MIVQADGTGYMIISCNTYLTIYFFYPAFPKVYFFSGHVSRSSGRRTFSTPLLLETQNTNNVPKQRCLFGNNKYKLSKKRRWKIRRKNNVRIRSLQSPRQTRYVFCIFQPLTLKSRFFTCQMERLLHNIFLIVNGKRN